MKSPSVLVPGNNDPPGEEPETKTGKAKALERVVNLYLQPLFTWGHLPILGAARG